jgi:hypothetical protein
MLIHPTHGPARSALLDGMVQAFIELEAQKAMDPMAFASPSVRAGPCAPISKRRG